MTTFTTVTPHMTGPEPGVASRWIDALAGDVGLSDAVVVVGASADDALTVLLARRPGIRVVDLEPEPASERVAALLETAAARTLMQSGRLRVLHGPSYDGAADAWRVLDGLTCQPVILPNPGVFRKTPLAAKAAIATAKAIGRAFAGNTEARLRLGGRYIRQTLLSLPRLAREGDCSALENLLPATPAVVVAAGPSLDDTVGDLLAYRERCVVIAVDTAARPLLHHGIVPDLVVSIDPTAPNARHLCNLPGLERTWLVAEPSLHPAALSTFSGRTFFGRVSSFHPWPWLMAQGVARQQLTVWSSVLTAAFDVALRLGHDPILLTGADLSFGDGRVYCRHTVYEEDWAQSTTCGEDLSGLWQRIIQRQEPIVVEGTGASTPLRTSAAMMSARDWMLERLASVRGRTVVNCSGSGLLVSQMVQQSTIREILCKSPRVAPDVGSRLHAAHGDASRPSAAVLRRAREFVLTTQTMDERQLESAWGCVAPDGSGPDAVDLAARHPSGPSPTDAARPLLSFGMIPRNASVVVVGEFASIVCGVLARVRPDLHVREFPSDGTDYEHHRLSDRIDPAALPSTRDVVLIASSYNDDLAASLRSTTPLLLVPKLAVNLLHVLSRPLPWVSHAHRLFASASEALGDERFAAALNVLADDVERVKYTLLASDPGTSGCLFDRLDEQAGTLDLRDRVVDDLLRSACAPGGGLFVSGVDLSRVTTAVEAGIGTGTWLLELLRRSRPDSRHYAFDPNRSALVHGEAFQYLERDSRLRCSARPLWDRCTEALAVPDSGRWAVREYRDCDAARVTNGDYVSTFTDTVDEFARRHGVGAVDLVVMDIGGAESRALQGAALMLTRSRPQLAVAAYHTRASHADIPLLLDGLLPGYRLTVANHAGFKPGQKTIVYGTPIEVLAEPAPIPNPIAEERR